MRLPNKCMAFLLVSFVFVGNPFAVASPVEASESEHVDCDIGAMHRSILSDLEGAESIRQDITGRSKEGGSVEYYFSNSKLIAARSVLYGGTGRVNVDVFFKTLSDYSVRVIDSFYTVPITWDGSEVAATNEVRFVVCEGELVRGIGDDVVVDYHERLDGLVNYIIENQPDPE